MKYFTGTCIGPGTITFGCRDGFEEDIGSMEERDFFDERAEQRTHTLTCPHCRQSGDYEIGWIVRRKKSQIPRGADERDRARFAKAQSYMVRRDDLVGCKNVRCRKRFEVVGLQSVAFL